MCCRVSLMLRYAVKKNIARRMRIMMRSLHEPVFVTWTTQLLSHMNRICWFTHWCPQVRMAAKTANNSKMLMCSSASEGGMGTKNHALPKTAPIPMREASERPRRCLGKRLEGGTRIDAIPLA